MPLENPLINNNARLAHACYISLIRSSSAPFSPPDPSNLKPFSVICKFHPLARSISIRSLYLTRSSHLTSIILYRFKSAIPRYATACFTFCGSFGGAIRDLPRVFSTIYQDDEDDAMFHYVYLYTYSNTYLNNV